MVLLPGTQMYFSKSLLPQKMGTSSSTIELVGTVIVILINNRSGAASLPGSIAMP